MCELCKRRAARIFQYPQPLTLGVRSIMYSTYCGCQVEFNAGLELPAHA